MPLYYSALMSPELSNTDPLFRVLLRYLTLAKPSSLNKLNEGLSLHHHCFIGRDPKQIEIRPSHTW